MKSLTENLISAATPGPWVVKQVGGTWIILAGSKVVAEVHRTTDAFLLEHLVGHLDEMSRLAIQVENLQEKLKQAELEIGRLEDKLDNSTDKAA